MALHTYIVGQTDSGKTAVARKLAFAMSSKPGGRVLVYDPHAPTCGHGVNGWRGLVLNDWPRFVGAFWSSRGCLVVIDEAGDVFADNKMEARAMLTRGRHINPQSGGGGHSVCIIAQRHVLLDKTARNQCNTLFAFNVNADDANIIAADWNCPALADVLPTLPKLHYVHLRRFGQPVRGVLRF